ncbi:MAG TPA: MerR family transcriptional regulator [Gemmatimonadaceae bacterium]|jgi:DNA-binding transcriptional MerR regulator|nr:MerR family transcriptional regulator [Gemmatimonadaceae bacterium]
MPSPARTIGRVLEMIRPEFPDISVSKLRYLEAEGLITPDRQQPSGYRRFSQGDVDRLLYVLRAQRDRYLPLKVIREELEAIDRGEEPPTHDQKPEGEPAQEPRRTARGGGKHLMSRRQVLTESGIGEATMIQLERQRIIQPRRGTQLYGPEAVALAIAAKKLGGYGIDLRQLRVLQQAASMEAAFVEQLLEPHRRRSGGPPQELVHEMYRLVMQAHAALLHGQIL